jgi:hypothetical protein
VTRFGQVIIPILTVASVLFGDAIFYTLIVMVAFSSKLLNVIIVHLWEIESKGSGVLSLIFGLVGAGYALYSARKPKFKAVFQPLARPTPDFGVRKLTPALQLSSPSRQIKQQNFCFLHAGQLQRVFRGYRGAVAFG